MSFLNSFVPLLRSIAQRMRGDTVDSERISILSSQPRTQRENIRNTLTERCSSFSDSGSAVSDSGRKRSLSNGQRSDYSQNDRTFYTNSLSLSASDLEQGWKEGRSSMNGAVLGNTHYRRKSACKININRHPIDNSYIEQKYGIMPSETSSQKVINYLRSRCDCSFSCLISFITSLFPVLSWLPKYKLEYLLSDVISGFTIAILHIPQGLAYGDLASVKPENGLYVSFFPVLIYFLLGTSRHISIGTFAVISLMLSSAVYSRDNIVSRNETALLNLANETFQSTSSWPPTRLEIVTSMAMMVGLWQIFMGVFHLGSLTVVLSDQLISGFSTGAACHVATSQLKDLFGIEVKRHSGPLKLIFMLQDVFVNLVHTNLATLSMSAIAIFVLAIFKEQIDTRLKHRLRMPIPIDIIVVVLATTISYFAKFTAKYNVDVIKDIPTGLPPAVTPRFDILHNLLGDSFAIALVIFAISLSMAKLLAKKHKYIIEPNQELIALGCANVFSSFFACYPCSASLSRSLVQEKAGGKTQIAGLISCVIILVVLLALAPLFYDLPRCILACIILVALKGMFLQVKDFLRAWPISKLDALIWLVTFISTVFLDVIYGLVVGVIFSVLSVIARTVIPSKMLLGRIPNTDIYLDINRFTVAEEVKGMKIFHFESALYFINKELFKSYLFEHVSPKIGQTDEQEVKSSNDQIHRIIIDCSTFTFVDISGLETLIEIMKEYQDVGITVFLAGCSVTMQQIMKRSKFHEKVPHHPCIFPTIHDAVEYHYFPHSSVSDS